MPGEYPFSTDKLQKVIPGTRRSRTSSCVLACRVDTLFFFLLMGRRSPWHQASVASCFWRAARFLPSPTCTSAYSVRVHLLQNARSPFPTRDPICPFSIPPYFFDTCTFCKSCFKGEILMRRRVVHFCRRVRGCPCVVGGSRPWRPGRRRLPFARHRCLQEKGASPTTRRRVGRFSLFLALVCFPRIRADRILDSLSLSLCAKKMRRGWPRHATE